MLRRQRQARLETDAKLAAYVTDRLTEGWTPEQIAGRLRLGIERGLGAVCAETIYGWIYRAGQKAGRLWRCLTRHHARRRKRRPMLNNSSPGQAVYEPFSGSGTSLIAAQTCGRVSLSMELDPAYVDVAVLRWQAFTGETATLDGRAWPEVAAERSGG